jgi:hypothetical protein
LLDIVEFHIAPYSYGVFVKLAFIKFLELDEESSSEGK